MRLTQDTRMKNVKCSFCCITVPEDEAKGHFVAGPEAFICRGCVELCVGVFAGSDPKWRDGQIDRFVELRDRPPNVE